MSEKNRRTKIMVFGTFDGLHRGHIDFFLQAKKLAKNHILIVSIARDINVLKIKGKKPKLSERKRVTLIKKYKLVNKVVLSGTKNYLPHVVKEKPDIIALGYDQKAYVNNLKKDLKHKGLSVKIVRLKPYREKIYKSHLLHKKNILK